MTHSSPVPEFATHNRPSCHRGECGIDIPPRTISSLSTSITTPPAALPSRHAPGASVAPSAVAYFGLPSTSATPFK